MNPFQGAQVVLKNGDPITELRLGGSQERLLSESTGEFNANDRKELLRGISALLSQAEKGNVRYASMSAEQRDQAVQERREVLASAIKNPQEWQSLGADVAVRIEEQRNREGLMRKLCVGQNVRTGELPRVNVQMWDAVSVVATGPANVQYQLIRNKQFFPTEFEIVAHLRADRVEMEQVGADVLDNLYNQGLDSTMVQEDKIWKQAADLTVGTVNPLEYIAGPLTPQVLGNLRTRVGDWNLPVTTAVIANDLWADVIGNNDFAAFLDPVTKYDLVLNGELGTLVGLTLLTDGFRAPSQKVLNRGEIYVLTSPEHLGCYSDRGGIRSEPSNGTDQGSTARGWLLSEVLSFTLANPRGVAKGRKV